MTTDDETKTKIMQAVTTAEQFSTLYYKKMDGERQSMDKLYLDTASLTWNGNPVEGKKDITSFLQTKIPKTDHHIQSLDGQPVEDNAVAGQTTVLVQVAGTVRFGDKGPSPFQQNFMLTAMDHKWKVATDTFRSQG